MGGPVLQPEQRVWEQTGQRWGALAVRLAPLQLQQVQTSVMLRGERVLVVMRRC